MMRAQGAKPTFAVRRATQADVAGLVALMHDFYAEAAVPLDHEVAARSFHDLLADPSRGFVCVAHVGEKLIGHAVLAVRFTMEHAGLSGYIDDLYVVPEFRRLGAGNALIDALLAECRALGCKAVLVEVGASSTAAVALYGKFGLTAAQDDRMLFSRVLA